MKLSKLMQLSWSKPPLLAFFGRLYSGGRRPWAKQPVLPALGLCFFWFS